MLCKYLLYFSSAVLQEITFKSESDIYEFLPWLGLVGFSLNGIEAIFFSEYTLLYQNFSAGIGIHFNLIKFYIFFYLD